MATEIVGSETDTHSSPHPNLDYIKLNDNEKNALDGVFSLYADSEWIQELIQARRQILNDPTMSTVGWNGFSAVARNCTIGPPSSVPIPISDGEYLDMRRMFDGSIAQNLKLISYMHLRDELEKDGISFSDLFRIPLRVVPSRELNAGALAIEGGRPIIVYDLFSLQCIHLITQTFFCYIESLGNGSNDFGFSSEKFADALGCLAIFCGTGDTRALYFAEALGPSLTPEDKAKNSSSTFFTHLFLLMHEHGHIFKGHLDLRRTAEFGAAPRSNVKMYRNTETEEYEADEFAFEMMSRAFSKMAMGSVGMFAIQIFLAFYSIVEFVRNPSEYPKSTNGYPSALDRWKRIEKLHGKPSPLFAYSQFPVEGFVEHIISRHIPGSHIHRAGGLRNFLKTLAEKHSK